MQLICIQATYQAIEIAFVRSNHLVESVTESKMHASKNCIVLIDHLLKKYDTSVSSLHALGVNIGPAPFTTLRTVISTVNGISFASHIPLIGINGLDAFVREYTSPDFPQTVVLLHAFSDDVYFQLNNRQGCASLDSVLEAISTEYPQEIVRFLGNGARIHEKQIKERFAHRAFFPNPMPEFCSIEQLGIMTYDHIQSQPAPLSIQLLTPLYLKQLAY